MNVYVSVTVMWRFDEFDSIRLNRIRAMVCHFGPVWGRWMSDIFFCPTRIVENWLGLTDKFRNFSNLSDETSISSDFLQV